MSMSALTSPVNVLWDGLFVASWLNSPPYCVEPRLVVLNKFRSIENCTYCGLGSLAISVLNLGRVVIGRVFWSSVSSENLS